MGNVHKLYLKRNSRNEVLITPIEDEKKIPTWSRYTVEDIEQMRITDDDFEGERLCKPSASKDILFDRESLDKMEIRQPIRTIAGFKVFRDYDPSHRYAGGHDVAGGVGLDSSASVFIDFSTVPAQVVGTFASNTILPESFGDECYSEGNIFGGCILGIENNKFDQAVLKAKILGAKLYKEKPNTYGWNTNSLTKSNMILGLKKAITDGLIALNDDNLINEAKSYSRNDLIEKEQDARLSTRHFDLLIACAIAWAMKNDAEVKEEKQEEIEETEPLRRGIGI
jgi:hypothetical protein